MMRRSECFICGSKSGALYQAREMMFGFRDTFDYLECLDCGCVQLASPLDGEALSKYYPAGLYYSYQRSGRLPPERPRGLRGWLARTRNASTIFGNGIAGAALAAARPAPHLHWLRSWLRYLPRRSLNLRVLDVGCGKGGLLEELAEAGFRSLTGVDPYLPPDVRLHPGVTIHRVHFGQMTGSLYDLIIFNHSLEHMEDQVETLSHARNLLSADGVCRVEIPVADSEAWRVYKTNWVELDPPRHFYLHTARSMKIAASRAGLKVAHSEQMGTSFEFWGSEFYTRDITLFDPEKKAPREPGNVFDNIQMEAFQSRSDTANREKRGGRAVFWLARDGGA